MAHSESSESFPDACRRGDQRRFQVGNDWKAAKVAKSQSGDLSFLTCEMKLIPSNHKQFPAKSTHRSKDDENAHWPLKVSKEILLRGFAITRVLGSSKDDPCSDGACFYMQIL